MTTANIGLALLQGSVEDLEKAIAAGEDINGRSGNLPYPHLHRTLILGLYDLAEVLIRHGANVDITDNNGQTALVRALRLGKLDGVKLLLAHGASLEKSELGGRSILHQLVDVALTDYYRDKNYPERTETLLEGCRWVIENIADWARPDENGTHPLVRASERPDFAAALSSCAARQTMRGAISPSAARPQA